MSTEFNEQLKPDFFVKLPSDKEPPSPVGGRSLFSEITRLSDRVDALCQAVLSLVDLQSELNQKVDRKNHAPLIRCGGFMHLL